MKGQYKLTAPRRIGTRFMKQSRTKPWPRWKGSVSTPSVRWELGSDAHKHFFEANVKICSTAAYHLLIRLHWDRERVSLRRVILSKTAADRMAQKIFQWDDRIRMHVFCCPPQICEVKMCSRAWYGSPLLNKERKNSFWKRSRFPLHFSGFAYIECWDSRKWERLSVLFRLL